MDRRTTSQEASPNGHQEAENAAAAHTPTPWLQVRLHPSWILGAGQLGRHSFCLRADALFERKGPGAAKELCEANAELIVKAVNSYASNAAELAAAYERISKLEADLIECREYIEQEVDVVDGDYGQPAPNRAMSLCSMIDETLHGPGAF